MMRYYLVFAYLFLPTLVIADVPPEKKNEVDHLLVFVKSSDCTLSRNGSEYSGEKAVKHIKKKYDYFIDDINTTEEFIKYSATKSTMSGKFYKISCPGKEVITAKAWLLDELSRYRKTKDGLLTNED